MRLCILPVTLCFAAFLQAQTTDEDLKIYTDHPRLFLKAQRLKMLRRERDRQSDRWNQLELLVKGKAQLPEPGFSMALRYQITGDDASAKGAIAAALAPTAELRQVALVFDWCQPVLTESQSRQMAARLKTGIDQTASKTDTSSVSARVLAAVALAGTNGYDAQPVLDQTVRNWWRKQVAPELKDGRRILSTVEIYPLMELLHAVRDNVLVELREDAPRYFKELPAVQMLSYYPATYPSAENDYHIPAFTGRGEPDLKIAALSRIAELSIVAYDSNALESQFLQGWLLHDRFSLKGTYGAPYEFLWANPYQPGLSYYHMPLKLHDDRTGRLFLRSNWEEDATWLGYFDRQTQLFDEGKIQVIALKNHKEPLLIGDSEVIAAKPDLHFTIDADGPTTLYVVEMKPKATYAIEIDDEELTDATTDVGGILPIHSARKDRRDVRVTPWPAMRASK